MTNAVLTIVSGDTLDNRVLKSCLEALKSIGIDRVAEPAWLDAGRAADILFEARSPEAISAVRARVTLDRADIFVQMNDEFRRKKLLVADMDATIVVGETMDELAAHLGIRDKVAPITERGMRGEIDFHESLRLRTEMLKGLTLDTLHEAVAEMQYTKGAKTLVKTMNAYGAKCALISGGFEQFVHRTASELGFYKNACNRYEIGNGALTGRFISPVIDKDAKKKFLESETRALALDIRHTMAVGDGANDIPMLQAAGVGVGYFGKPAVQAATPYQVRFTDLESLLYMQGYRAADFRR